MKVITTLITFISLLTFTSLSAQLDLGFGDNGNVIDSPYTYADTRSIVSQDDGKIVGLIFHESFSGGEPATKLFRLMPDGTYDTTFGDAGFSDLPNIGGGDKILLQDDGKILVSFSAFFAFPAATINLMRFNTDGSVDTSFGNNGIVDTGLASWFPAKFHLQNNQKILLGVDDVLHRFDVDGSLDTSFDADGTVTIPATINSINELSDGKLLVNTTSATYRYNVNGSLDTSFGNSGNITHTGIMRISLTDGSIVFGSDSADDQYLEITKYTSDGILDIGFGANGIASLALPQTNYPDANYSRGRRVEDILIQSTGKIIVIGAYYYNLYYSSNNYTTFYEEKYRLNENGTEDNSFDTNPSLIFEDESGENSVSITAKLLANDDFLLYTSGYVYFGNGSIESLKHVSSSGADFTFDSGYLNKYSIGDIVQQADNKILVAGAAYVYDDLGENNVIGSSPWVRRYCPQEYFGANGCGITLPLELAYFKGYTTTRNTNILQWQTISETNTNKILLERSVNIDKWETLETVQAQGNSNATINYEVEDLAPFLQTYYRLKMIDADGSTYFSDVISLKRSEQNGISIYPNPAGKDITLQFTTTQTTSIRISNIIGSILQEVTSVSDTGLHSRDFDISKFPRGLYFITIDDGQRTQTKRFVKR